ncbi:MAG: vitamin K epoxide reductase family protein [Anaerolineales bacterium]
MRNAIETSSLLGVLRTDTLRLISLALAVFGAINAGYLAWTKLMNTNVYCGPGSSACDAVSASQYGYLFGIPVSYLGFVSYVALIVLFVLERRGEFFKANNPFAVFGLTLFGALFSGYLQYASLFLLREVCPYCVVNALLMVALFILSLVRLRRQWLAA